MQKNCVNSGPCLAKGPIYFRKKSYQSLVYPYKFASICIYCARIQHVFIRQRTDLDHLIANLGKTLLANAESFEGLAKQETNNIGVNDLVYLRYKLHHPPPVHPDINENELGLGSWLATCQYAIFELIYLLDLRAIDLLKSIAFGEYDWTQATALEVLCRIYADGKIPVETIHEIDSRLGNMRYETHLYFAQGLIYRRERDQRFDQIIKQFQNADFHLALAELGYKQPMTREELIKLGKKILAANSDEEETQKLMELFDQHVPYPNGSNLFFYSGNFNSSTGDMSEYNPSVEEIVDKCLSYKST